MRLWLDAEFNGFNGDLISIALVDDDGREWYEVLACSAPTEWVAAHVMPRLLRPPITRQAMQLGLKSFLSVYDSIHVVADWPEDLRHFLDLLIVGPGVRMNLPPLMLELSDDLPPTVEISALPHNALEDARALRRAGLGI